MVTKHIPAQLRSELEFAVAAYATTLVVVAVSIAGALIASGYALGDGWSIAVLSAAAALSERGRVHLTSTTEESISLLPTLFAAVLFGPVAGMIVGAASLITEFGQPPHLKWVTYTSSRAIGGAVIAEVLDVAFALGVAQLRRTRRPSELVRTLAPLIASSVPLYAPLVTLLAVAYRDLSPLTLPLFIVPALAAQRLFVLYQEQRRLADDLRTVNERLERANLSFATALVATLDARDRYTAGHSAAVATYSRDIAQRMGLSEREQGLVHLCGLVHDIGKVGLPPGLLEKPGALTLDERRIMEGHSEIGERILAKVDDYAEIAAVVRHHHERVDGNGYPEGLRKDEIPLLSRIIAVADAYNAMTSDRPYREAMPSRVARLRLAQAVESQFDTSVVAAFEAILASASEEYRIAHGVDFMLEVKSHDELADPRVLEEATSA